MMWKSSSPNVHVKLYDPSAGQVTDHARRHPHPSVCSPNSILPIPYIKFLSPQQNAMAKATPGTLIKCDPAIVAIIEKLNEQNANHFIKDRLGEEFLLIESKSMDDLKGLLKEVWILTLSKESVVAKGGLLGAQVYG